MHMYTPTSVAAEEEREEFYRLLEKTIQEEKSYYKYVVGDFNAVVGTNCSGDWRLGPYGSGDRTENGELLLNLLNACRLFHGNSMFEKPANRRWTWESPNGRTHTEIDHVLTNRRWSLLDVSMLPSFDTGSDHRLVRAKIRLNKRIFKRDTHRPAHFKTPSFDTELLESAIKAHDWCLLEDPTEDYEHLTKGLLKCADISRRPHLARIPRLSALAVSLLEKRRALKQDPNADHVEKVLANKACRMAVKQFLREYRRTKLLKAAEARSSIRRCKRDLSDQKAVMSALLDKDGSVKTSRSSMENIVQDFYTELFRSSTFVPKCSMPPYEEPPAILDSEVANAIRSMKKGTAPGLDNIPADLLRSGSTALHTLLAEHFNHYIRLKRIPQQWKESKTVLLFKKGQREDISNYRPISLLSVVYKSFTKVLLNRVERILDNYQPVEQTGFRKNFSCMDNIHAVCQLIERSREYRLPLALLFVDYKKAFDSVEINAVLNALVQAGVDPAYVHLLEQCLSNTSTFIQLFERKLKISVGKGMRQGDTISPKLFTAALQYAMLNLDWEERGYPVNGKKVNNLRFADDIVLISSSTAEMEKMVNELNAVSRRIGLEMNMSKTQLMVNKWCDTGTVRLEGKALQRVESYVYLGRELNMTNNIAPELNRRRRAAWAAFGSVREVTDQVSDPDLKASIFSASVLPAMCYATETWPDNKTIAKAIMTSHHALERSFLKISRRQQWQLGLRSSDLKERSRLKDPLQYMANSKHRWAGHLLRRTDDRWSLRVTEWLPRNKRRPSGRPPTRWADSFSKYFRQSGLHWMQVAKDRAMWRSCGPR
uniref:Reverse transcriptase domain-containing protein n=1 Tax=Haemonchus contortus TaxID=6289 RepID=A0A7I4YM96_HAECO